MPFTMVPTNIHCVYCLVLRSYVSLAHLIHTLQILFLNKDDIFKEKIKHSDIRTHFPDYEGESGDVQAGREYFRTRFTKLSRKSGQAREREIYVQ